ncbi:hypothetical protein BT96DRAFT_935438 [Gymnopus androsaceus JB14]|uniref:Uncharacterized protein n=1 Tax=Gymnopus androsaceus JB14 TaxID=1447944 RepID=A0A6A4HZC1_9AGAR|nr:hypothetical protein BT96DRAFT_935438 [Gymnopus androsaceus JB14]
MVIARKVVYLGVLESGKFTYEEEERIGWIATAGRKERTEDEAKMSRALEKVGKDIGTKNISAGKIIIFTVLLSTVFSTLQVTKGKHQLHCIVFTLGFWNLIVVRTIEGLLIHGQYQLKRMPEETRSDTRRM